MVSVDVETKDRVDCTTPSISDGLKKGCVISYVASHFSYMIFFCPHYKALATDSGNNVFFISKFQAELVYHFHPFLFLSAVAGQKK